MAAQTCTVISIQLFLFHAMQMVNVAKGERSAVSLNSRAQTTTEPKWHCCLPVLSGAFPWRESQHIPQLRAEGCSQQDSLLSLHQHFSSAESFPHALSTKAAGSAAPRGSWGSSQGWQAAPYTERAEFTHTEDTVFFYLLLFKQINDIIANKLTKTQ